MKKMLSTTEYIFTAGSNSLDFSVYPDFDPKRLLAVINTTTGQTIIYATGGGPSSPTGGLFSGSLGGYVLTLNFNTSTSGMSNSDTLQIIYDESVGTEEAKASIDIVSGKSGLDVNLLNSSYGGTLGDVMPAPFQSSALSIGILNGGVLESPTMNVNNELIVDVTQSGTVPVSVAQTVYTDIISYGGGTPLIATQPLPATPTNPSTGGYQSFGGGATDSNTQRVTANINQISDVFFVGAAQSAIQNNIITGFGPSTDVSGFRSFSAQLICTATSGVFIFEGSNDNINFQPIPVFNQSLSSGVAHLSGITATASQIIYTGSLPVKHLRIRIATALTGGTVSANVKLSPIAFVPIVQMVAQSTSSNLNCAVSGATLQSTTSLDVAGTALTATSTSATLSLTNSQSLAFYVSVSATSGTGQKMDVILQETFDNVNFFDFYHFPTITAVGQYFTPLMRISGSAYRIIRTISGTSPSFTSAITRKINQASASINKMFVNKGIDPNTIGSSTPAFIIDGCDKIQLSISMNGGGTGIPAFKLQGSEDQGLWYDLGTTTVAVPVSSAGAAIYSGYIPKFVRAQVTTAGSGTVLSHLSIKGKGE